MISLLLFRKGIFGKETFLFNKWNVSMLYHKLILPQKIGGQVKPLFISGGSISEVNNNYPCIEYLGAKLLKDIKSIVNYPG